MVNSFSVGKGAQEAANLIFMRHLQTMNVEKVLEGLLIEKYFLTIEFRFVLRQTEVF